MLGENFGEVGWPECGEIDIMENIGREPGTVHGTLHLPGYSGANGISGRNILPEGRAMKDEFHIFAVEWQPKTIRWYMDTQLYFEVMQAQLPKGTPWPFDHPFFLLLNLAVGGDWPGSPDDTTAFPQVMLIDYVRVYQTT
jgi:beta-glucanase (GH16 family)